MKSKDISGLGVALATPFKADKSIDYAALERLLEHVVEGGADFAVALGSTAETPTLTAAEKEKVRRFVVEKISGRIPLVAGMGGNCTAALVDEIKSTDLTGYDAILSVAPYYNKPSQEGLYLHFSAVAEASPIPVILYNVPGRTGVNISAETTLRLARSWKNIIAVKEASGNMKQIEEIIAGAPEGFTVLSGDDGLTYPLMELGAKGVISVVGNALTRRFADLVHLCQEGKFQEARPLHYKLLEFYDQLFAEGNPSGIKYVLWRMGLMENELRLPLVAISAATGDRIDALLPSLL